MSGSPEFVHPSTPRLELNSGRDDIDSDATTSPEGRLPSSRSLTAGRRISSSQNLTEASERLLPPSRSRPRRFRDDISPTDSRRTSWSSESASSRDSRSPFYTPFDDSRAPSRAGSDDEAVNTQTVSEKYNILPTAGLLLYPEDVEKDDYLHNPDPNDKDGLVCSELFSKRGIANLGGLLLLSIGLLLLFIFYPVLCDHLNLLHFLPADLSTVPLFVKRLHLLQTPALAIPCAYPAIFHFSRTFAQAQSIPTLHKVP